MTASRFWIFLCNSFSHLEYIISKFNCDLNYLNQRQRQNNDIQYLFFMVIKFCWQEIFCLKCNLLDHCQFWKWLYNWNLKFGSSHIRGELCWLCKCLYKKLKWCTNLWKCAKSWFFAFIDLGHDFNYVARSVVCTNE